MERFYQKHKGKIQPFGEKDAFKIMHRQLHKAMDDYATGGDYCEHIAELKELCEDFLEVKGYTKQPSLLHR